MTYPGDREGPAYQQYPQQQPYTDQQFSRQQYSQQYSQQYPHQPYPAYHAYTSYPFQGFDDFQPNHRRAPDRRRHTYDDWSRHDPWSTDPGQGGLPPMQGAPSEPSMNPWRGNNFMEYYVPRWQPDSEVNECPHCEAAFTFLHRKHHCRKCGRVVCAACSPHRITIPRQFVVRPPDPHQAQAGQVLHVDEYPPSPTNPDMDLGGGEVVRVCNPCVPDPNLDPPGFLERSRAYTSGDEYVSASCVPVQTNIAQEVFRRPNRPRTRAPRPVRPGDYGYDRVEFGVGHPFGYAAEGSPAPRRRRRHIDERDICPICNRQFRPLTEAEGEEAREAHIRDCIENHGAARTQRQGQTDTQNENQTQIQAPPPPPPPVKMIGFPATEKDCIGPDGATQECTICMEEYQVGERLVRLECLCMYHKQCIVEWFSRKQECPMHKT